MPVSVSQPLRPHDARPAGLFHREVTMNELVYMQSMTESQRFLFQSEMSRERKDRTVALLLTLFLGGLGAHRFYLGQVGLGVVYVVFCWTFIPAIVAFVELFLITSRVDAYNAQKATEIAMRVKSLASGAAPTGSPIALP